MKFCPKCSAEFADQLNFCRQDGTALKPKETARTCSHCGNEIGKDSKFCRHCGTTLETPKSPQNEEIRETLVVPSIATRELEVASASSIDVAEEHLKQGRYREAISALDTLIATNPEHRVARLLHLYATIKLYNIYGYEKQIESLRSLSDLTEKERELVKEVFLIRAEEARQRGKTDDAREYQRLSTRVILGQPLAAREPESEAISTKHQPPQQESRPNTSSPRLQQHPQTSRRATASTANEVASNIPKNPRIAQRKSHLVASFVIVFGLAGILTAGMLLHYARKKGISVTDLFKTASPTKPQSEGKLNLSATSLGAQVVAAEELGFKVWGTGATDASRSESVISERIASQLSDVRTVYEKEVQNKPELMGSIVLQLNISAAGTVTKVEEYASRIRDDEFSKLVINEAYKWRFPEAPAGFTKVNYPLLFVPPKMDVATVLQWERGAGPGKVATTGPSDKIQLAEGPKTTHLSETGTSSQAGEQKSAGSKRVGDQSATKFLAREPLISVVQKPSIPAPHPEQRRRKVTC